MKLLPGAAPRLAAHPLAKAARWSLALASVIALAHCTDDRLAGSSVTTGNPTEIQVGFTGENGPAALSGRVEIYAATQIPVPGFRPEPLGRFVVVGTSFALTANHFANIADSMWAEGSLVGDSLARFNLVFADANSGAILRDMAIRLKDRKFDLKEGTFTPGMDGAVSVQTGIKPYAAYEVVMDSVAMSISRFHFLFLQGSPWYAAESTGVFRFPALPLDAYRLSYVAVPNKANAPVSVMDSLSIYTLDRPVQTGSTAVIRGDAEYRLPVPASYR